MEILSERDEIFVWFILVAAIFFLYTRFLYLYLEYYKTISELRILKNIFSRFNIIHFPRLSNIRERIRFIRENTNDSLWNIIKELILYKTRTYILNIMSTGLVVRYPPAMSYTDLVYHDGSDLYTVRFPKQRGPRPFTSVSNEKGEDVSDVLIKYMGPYNNFHGIPTTPVMLGFTELCFKNSRTHTTQTFESYDVIFF